MVNLIQNENMKIYRRTRTWIMSILLVVIVIAGSLLMFFLEDGNELSSGAWRDQLESRQTDYKTELSRSSDDAGRNVEFLEDELQLIDYRLTHDIPPLHATMWGAITNLTSLIFLITLFVVVIAGDSIAGEFSTGTIKLLLIRPASRSKILLSKYCATILYGIFLLLILFLSSFLINGILFGFSGWSVPTLSMNAEGLIQEQNTVLELWKTYFYESLSTVMFVTFAFMISAVFRSSAMAIGISLFSMFIGFTVTAIFQQYAWSKYSLFANIDLTQYLRDMPFRDEMTMGFSISVLIGYFVLFNLLSWVVFTRRDVAA